MKKLLNAASGWGWLLALAAVALFAFGYWIARPPIEDVVTQDGPDVPSGLVDEYGERAGLERGYQFGAEPAVALPRPTQLAGYGYYASPNFSGRGTCEPEAIVIHVTGPGSMAGMRSWFKNPASQVSAHFGIGKQGELDQYVPLEASAWHAGILNRPNLANPLIARWVAEGINPNRCHVGIELLLGGPAEPLVEYPLMEAQLDALLVWLSGTLGIPLDRTHVIGHYEIDAVSRSTDPRCCVSIDDVLAGIVAPPVAVSDWGACDTSWSPGGCWNLEIERWVSAIGIFDPEKPEAGWQAPPLP